MHAYVKDSAILEYPIINIRQRLPDTSLPADLSKDDRLPEGYVFVNDSEYPTFNSTLEKVIESTPVYRNNKWCRNYVVVPLEEQEVQESKVLLTKQIRNSRNQLLSQTDWTQAKDIPDSVSQLWAPYRQALRDVTQQPDFPFKVVWPTAPY